MPNLTASLARDWRGTHMQSKIAHKAERAAFGLALDQIIKTASGPDREKNLEKLLDMAGNLLKDTSPGAIRGIRNGL